MTIHKFNSNDKFNDTLEFDVKKSNVLISCGIDGTGNTWKFTKKKLLEILK